MESPRVIANLSKVLLLTALSLVSADVLAASANPMASPPPSKQIPAGTLLCTAENDLLKVLGGQPPGLTCFRLNRDSEYAVLSRSAGYQQVKLTNGERKGVSGWMVTLVEGPRR